MSGANPATDRRIWLLALAAALLLVWGVGTLTREPWPAVIFPSFGSVPSDGGAEETAVSLFVLHGADSTAQVEAGELFNGAFDSFHAEMIESMIETDPVGSTELESWFSTRADDLLGWSDCVQMVEVVESTGDPTGDGARPVDAVLNQIEFPSCA